MIRFVVVAAVLAVVGCGTSNPQNADDCISAFAKTAATTKLVRAAYGNCQAAFDDKLHPLQQARAMCAVKQIPSLKTEAAFSVVAKDCAAQFPTPDCDEGKTFDFGLDTCAVTCNYADKRSDDGQSCIVNPFSQFDNAPPTGFVLDQPPTAPGAATPTQPLEDFDPFPQAATAQPTDE